jgi:hypothetical protein
VLIKWPSVHCCAVAWGWAGSRAGCFGRKLRFTRRVLRRPQSCGRSGARGFCQKPITDSSGIRAMEQMWDRCFQNGDASTSLLVGRLFSPGTPTLPLQECKGQSCDDSTGAIGNLTFCRRTSFRPSSTTAEAKPALRNPNHHALRRSGEVTHPCLPIVTQQDWQRRGQLCFFSLVLAVCSMWSMTKRSARTFRLCNSMPSCSRGAL